MKIIDVPVYNNEGSVQFTAQVTPEQAQTLLQFAYNFLVASGLTKQFGIVRANNDEDDSDFKPGLNE